MAAADLSSQKLDLLLRQRRVLQQLRVLRHGRSRLLLMISACFAGGAGACGPARILALVPAASSPSRVLASSQATSRARGTASRLLARGGQAPAASSQQATCATVQSSANQ